MVISHNTMTYRKCQWWLRPIAWVARCQSAPYWSQRAGGFDLRIYWKDGRWEFRHGIFRYGDGLGDVLHYANAHGMRVRLMLEDRNSRTAREVAATGMEERFAETCGRLAAAYPGVTFSGGRNMRTWKRLFDFGGELPEYEHVSSVDGNRVNDLWPWLYAKTHNGKVMTARMGTSTDECHLFDFV